MARQALHPETPRTHILHTPVLCEGNRSHLTQICCLVEEVDIRCAMSYKVIMYIQHPLHSPSNCRVGHISNLIVLVLSKRFVWLHLKHLPRDRNEIDRSLSNIVIVVIFFAPRTGLITPRYPSFCFRRSFHSIDILYATISLNVQPLAERHVPSVKKPNSALVSLASTKQEAVVDQRHNLVVFKGFRLAFL